MIRNTFTRNERLKSNKEIKKVFDQGVRFRARLITVFLLDGQIGSESNRAAFIIRKNLYNKKLVLRNRFRRILREGYRNTKNLLSPCHDLIILGVNLKKDTKSSEIQKELTHVFKKCIKK